MSPKATGHGTAFGSGGRFSYYESAMKPLKARSPSPANYKLNGSFGADAVSNPDAVPGPTFGVSRD